jgi:hypothetical protein
VLILHVIPKLNLTLYPCEFAGFLLRNWMSAVNDGVPGLDVQQIELHRIVRVYILVGEEELAPQEDGLVLVYSLFPERLRRVQPVDVVVGVQLLPELVHLSVAFFLLLLPLQRESAVVSVVDVLLVLQIFQNQRVLVVVCYAELRTNHHHQIGDDLRVVHHHRLHRTFKRHKIILTKSPTISSLV